jgi:hypothetical protein
MRVGRFVLTADSGSVRIEGGPASGMVHVVEV